MTILKLTIENVPSPRGQAIAEARAETSDQTIFGLDQDKFREFQEDRKQAALEADKQDLSRELSFLTSLPGRRDDYTSI